MLIGLFFYFVIAIAMLGCICLPPLRDMATLRLHRLWHKGWRTGAFLGETGVRHLGRGGDSLRAAVGQAMGGMQGRATALSLALLLVVGLPLAAVLLRATFRVDSFDPDATRAVDERVAELLRGEDLAPPPALPPELFTTLEVEGRQPLARSASRQWDLLEEAFRQRLLMSFRLMRQQYGYEMVLLEGYRSPQRQAALAALGPSVTQAAAFESYHQFGLAADCAFMRDGRIVISEKDAWAMAGYERYGEVARSLGLVWGGDWRSLRDFGHVELHRARVRSDGVGNRAMSVPAIR